MFIYRNLIPEILKHLKKKTGIAVIGPRRIGKSVILQKIVKQISGLSKSLIYNLDDLDLRTRISNNPNFFSQEIIASGCKYLIIDEAQKLPKIFEQIKTLIDQKQCKVILTGSSSLQIRQKSAETFGGRIRMLRAFPFSLAEIYQTRSFIESLLNKKKLTMTWLKTEQKRLWQIKLIWENGWKNYLLTGFLPEVFLDKNRENKFYLLKDFIQNYLEKDILLLSRVLQIEDFRAVLSQFAYQNGQILNTVSLSTESGMARKTINNYLSLLKQTFLIYQISAVTGKKRSSMFKMPKIYFFDMGVANYLLGLSSFEQIKVANRQGALTENFVLTQLIPHTENLALPTRVAYWQNYQGQEVDFIVEKGMDKFPIEVTLADSIKQEKINNLSAFMELFNLTTGILLYRGELRQISVGSKTIFAIPLWMWV